MKFIVKRKDIASNNVFDISSLFRLAITDKNKLIYDKNRNLKGRGIYIKKDIESINIAFSKKLNRYNKKNFESLRKELMNELK